MNIKISRLLFLQMLLLLFTSIAIYFISSSYVDHFLIFLALLFAVITFIYFLYIRKIAGLDKSSFSLTLLFILSYFIVFFQFPTDLILSSFSDNNFYSTIIYDESILVKSVWYSVCFLILMCLGMHFQLIKMNSSNKIINFTKTFPEKPFFYLFYLFFFLHLTTVDSGYYTGGVSEDLQGLAGSILSYFIVLLPICFGVVIYNYKSQQKNADLNFIGFIRIFPLIFIIIILLFSFFTFLAGDRGPAIRALILLVGSYYITTNKKLSYLKFIVMILIGGFFLSTIKLIGAINYNENLIESFLSAAERLGTSTKSESFSPFTAELSGSFRAYNTGFSLWSSGYSLYGLGVLVGLLMSVPYAVTTFMEAFNLNKIDINSSNLITEFGNERYGLGTTIIGDSLLNIGFIPTLVLAFILGRIFLKFDHNLFVRPVNVYIYVLGLYLLMNSIVLVRSSIFPTIGNAIFIVFIVFFIDSFSRKINK